MKLYIVSICTAVVVTYAASCFGYSESEKKALAQAINQRVSAADKSIANMLAPSTRKASVKSVQVLLSFAQPVTIEHALAFAKRYDAKVDGFGHQVGTNFGAFHLEPTDDLETAVRKYKSEYADFMTGLSERMMEWARTLPDEAARQQAREQAKRINAKRDAQSNWNLKITGLELTLRLDALRAITESKGGEVLAVEPRTSDQRRALPIPNLSEMLE